MRRLLVCGYRTPESLVPAVAEYRERDHRNFNPEAVAIAYLKEHPEIRLVRVFKAWSRRRRLRLLVKRQR